MARTKTTSNPRSTLGGDSDRSHPKTSTITLLRPSTRRESAPSYLAKSESTNTRCLETPPDRLTASSTSLPSLKRPKPFGHGRHEALHNAERGFTAVGYPARTTPPGISAIKWVSTEAVERRYEGGTRLQKSLPSAMIAALRLEQCRILYRPLQKATAGSVEKEKTTNSGREC